MTKIITNTDKNLGETVFNCNPNLTHYVIPVHDPLWFDFRTVGAMGYEGGFGASEVYKCAQIEAEKYEPVLPQLMEIKAGISPSKRVMTAPMMAGILHEQTILKFWMYYDGTHDGYLTNFMLNDPKRAFGTVGAYIVNKNYPWLFVSLDAYLKKGYSSLDGEFMDVNSPLECKSIGYQAAQSYDSGVPKSWVFQVQTQMLVTESDYAELAVLEGGNKFVVHHFRANTKLQEIILENSYKHWQTVLRMRELKQEREALILKGMEDKAMEKYYMIQNILPIPSSGDAYDAYYTEKHQPREDDSQKGTLAQFKMIRNRIIYQEMASLWENEADRIDNYFRSEFVKNRVNILDFGKAGRLKFVKRSNGANYFPDYKGVKDKPDKLSIQKAFLQQFKDI